MQDTHISLAHGNGGLYMRELIDEIFAKHLSNPELDVHADAVPIEIPDGDLLITTDGFTVQPLEFPGGNIGSLAVHGTTNDLAVAGAIPKYLSLNAFIEEGLEISVLDRIIKTLADTAREVGVKVVCGDTKVLPRGEGGGLYLATTGVGIRDSNNPLGINQIKDRDAILLSGPVGDHGIAIMLAREQFGLRGDIKSDAASVLDLTQAASEYQGLRFMRDPTRGGLATVCTEIKHATAMGVRLKSAAIPIRDPVQSVCDMLGYDPLYLACEGRVVAVIDPEFAPALLASWRGIDAGKDASLIGYIDNQTQQVLLETEIGGERILEELEDDPLPRIC
jgi:hydrogenase expression/formation protein HypE